MRAENPEHRAWPGLVVRFGNMLKPWEERGVAQELEDMEEAERLGLSSGHVRRNCTVRWHHSHQQQCSLHQVPEPHEGVPIHGTAASGGQMPGQVSIKLTRYKEALLGSAAPASSSSAAKPPSGQTALARGGPGGRPWKVDWGTSGSRWRRVREKCEIKRAKNLEFGTSARKVRNHAGQSVQSIQSVPGDKWGTNLKSCGQIIQRVAGGQIRGRQARNQVQSIQSVLKDKWGTKLKSRGLRMQSVGDKWGTNVKSCGLRTQRLVGEKW